MTLSEEDVNRMAKRKENVKRIMHDLIWPAAAGNVAWSFIDTTLKYFNDPSPGTPFQILSILLLALYLLLSFLDSKPDAGYKCPILDIAHPLSVIVVAIGIAQTSELSYLKWLVIGMFAIAGAGHFVGAWLPADVPKKWKKNWLGLIHAIAAILCFFLYDWQKVAHNYGYVCIAIVFDLAVWKCFRKKIYYNKWR